MKSWAGALGVVAAAVLAGCGSPVVTTSVQSAADPYQGPMRLPQDFGDRASVAQRGGAAAHALECTTVAYAGGAGAYDSGLETVQDSPAEALDNWLEEEQRSSTVPDGGYRVEREDDGRVLLSYDVEGSTRAAVVVADGIRDWRGRTGWGVESWAGCDPVELPGEILDALEVDVWEDGDGELVPVAKVRSYDDWCDLPGVTLLQVGPEWRRQQWWRDPGGKVSLGGIARRYDADATLPAAAEPTGWRRDGRELWLVPDRSAAYLVSTGDPDDVERWPGSRGFGCAD